MMLSENSMLLQSPVPGLRYTTWFCHLKISIDLLSLHYDTLNTKKMAVFSKERSQLCNKSVHHLYTKLREE